MLKIIFLNLIRINSILKSLDLYFKHFEENFLNERFVFYKIIINQI